MLEWENLLVVGLCLGYTFIALLSPLGSVVTCQAWRDFLTSAGKDQHVEAALGRVRWGKSMKKMEPGGVIDHFRP